MDGARLSVTDHKQREKESERRRNEFEGEGRRGGGKKETKT